MLLNKNKIYREEALTYIWILELINKILTLWRVFYLLCDT